MIKDEGCTAVVPVWCIDADVEELRCGSDIKITWSDRKVYDSTFFMTGKETNR